jgi:hypothetical protein
MEQRSSPAHSSQFFPSLASLRQWLQHPESFAGAKLTFFKNGIEIPVSEVFNDPGRAS